MSNEWKKTCRVPLTIEDLKMMIEIMSQSGQTSFIFEYEEDNDSYRGSLEVDLRIHHHTGKFRKVITSGKFNYLK